MTIEEILTNAQAIPEHEARIEFLSLHHRERDEKISVLQKEKQVLHDAAEPLHIAVNAKKTGPAHLRQTVGLNIPDTKLGGQ